jgi:predicted esterase
VAEVLLFHHAQAAQSLPDDVVHAGFSLGVMPAQMLAQTRPGAKGALLLHGGFPLDEFGGGWPNGLPLPIHTMEDDDEAAAALVRQRVLGFLAGLG